MSKSFGRRAGREGPPPLELGESGQPEVASLGNLIQWFLDRDRRVAMIRSAQVEEIFQWKQSESLRTGEDVFQFNSAEDRLVIGIMQALALHETERGLHEWISQLLNALDDATKTSGEIAAAHGMEISERNSTLDESAKISEQQLRSLFLNCFWLQALCTAEIRILGWVYQELYGQQFAPA